MSGSKKKPGVSKVAFIGKPPASFKLLWQPLIDWVKKVAVAEGIYVSLLEIHYHDSKSVKCPLGEAGKDTPTVMLCTFYDDKDTALHELAHVATPGFHSAEWSELFLKLINKWLSGKARARAVYHACRDYRGCSKAVRNGI